MRKLIVVRIVHAPSDMGSAGEGLEKKGISAMGKQAWEENQKKIERFWQELETEVDGLGLDAKHAARLPGRFALLRAVGREDRA